MKCQIQWVDKSGNSTADENEAIGIAVCYDPLSFGEKGSEPSAICKRHAEQKGKWWKLLPLPGQDLEDAHELVRMDRYFKVIPDVVTNSIKKSFPNDFQEILDDLQWSGDHFSFIRWGMYIGVELDGHIHT